MASPVVRDVGAFVRAQQGAETLIVPLPPANIGDLLVLVVRNINLDLSEPNAGRPDTPGGWTEEHFVETSSSSLQLFWRRHNDPAAQNVILSSGEGQSSGLWSGQAVSVRGVDWDAGPFTDFAYVNTAASLALGVDTGSDLGLPAMSVAGESLVVAYTMGESATSDSTTPFTVPDGYVGPYPFQGVQGSQSNQRRTLRLREADDDISAAGYSVEGGTEEPVMAASVYMLVIPGADAVTLPAEPQPAQVTFDCAATYEAFITDETYRRVIDRVGWSSLNWSRVLDEISDAHAILPDALGGARCCIRYGGVEAWRFGLLIERNAQEVWSGPITDVSRIGDSIELTANDVLSRYQKRLAVRDAIVDYENADTGRIFADIINTHARVSSDTWSLPCPEVFVDSSISRKLIPRQLEMAWDVLADLLDSTLDAFVANGVLFVWEPGFGWAFQDTRKRQLPGPYNRNHDLVFGVFTEQSFSVRPDWAMSGMNQANSAFVPGADSSETGFREIWSAENLPSQARYGVLDFVDASTLSRPEDEDPSITDSALQSRATSIAMLRAAQPAVISGGVLAQGAPIDINNLIPGGIWIFDIFDACWGQLLQAGRLKRVDVSVTTGEDGAVEEVTPTVFPIGFEEGP